MARRTVSKSELARIAGVAKPSISLACRASFPRALIGDRIDVDHADVQKYLTGKPGALTRLAEFFALGPTQPTASRPAPPPTHSPAERAAARRYAPPAPGQQLDVEAMLDLTLREIIALYGSVPAAGQILDLVRKGVDIREREIKIAVQLKKLVSRELVRTSVFAHLEGAYRRLFTETAVTIARRVHALGRSGQPVEDAEQLARDLLRQTIQPAKTAIVRALRTFGGDSEENDVDLTFVRGDSAGPVIEEVVDVQPDEHAP
jgi:hypothetical protein